jgi:hypothetical protein
MRYESLVQILDFCDRALNDPDKQLREWAQEQLCKMTNGE